MENRHRFLLGLGVDIFQGTASEKAGCLALLDRAKRRLRFSPTTVGADKGFFHEDFIEAMFARDIEPHIAVEERGSAAAHARVRMRRRGVGYRLSQRYRKLIEELFGEGKDWHGLRRFRRRGRHRVQQEAFLIGWALNLKRLVKPERRACSPHETRGDDRPPQTSSTANRDGEHAPVTTIVTTQKIVSFTRLSAAC